ncbi:MAG: YfhO family protein [Bacteroidales bacterium]|nr:YfhO family protein [Bacteroidales bacterium]
MKRFNIKNIYPHLLAILLFLTLTFAYFSPMLQGKGLEQHDIAQYKGMSKEIVDFRKATGQEPLWTNSMFGGMPAYLISIVYKGNLFRYVDKIFTLSIPSPARYLFLYMLGFYLLLVSAYKTKPWLGIVGAIAYGFSTYFLIILAAGHNSKAHTLGYVPLLIAGILIAFKKRPYWGALLTSVFLALQLNANHPQITYYTLLLILVYGIVILIFYFREHLLTKFIKISLVLLVAVVLAVATNIASLWLINEYGKVSIRGKSELTLDKQNLTGGLDKDYILNDYSYGIAETMNLLIPDFVGGASSGLGTKSKTYDLLRKSNVPNARQIATQYPLAYWGPQRFTSGPMYFGAVVIFLFVLGLFLVKGPEKWWLLSATILAIMLAWGKHLQFFSDFFIYYVPGYNKFRAVSMTLVIAEFSVPLLGILAVKEVMDGKVSKEDLLKSVKNTFFILGGITLFFALFPGLFFNFSAPVDTQLQSAGWPAQFIDAIRQDRKHLMQTDAWRSFAFVTLTALVLGALAYKKIKPGLFYFLLGGMILVDLWAVDKRYLNNDDFVPKKEVEVPFRPTQADLEILKDKSLDYRVMNLTVSTFNDASTSYFHKSVGGYHGAKMRRYQDLITYQISKNNMQVLNMLNTKYFIVNQKGQPTPQLNPGALGNAWFVETYQIVPNADSEMISLNNFDPLKKAIVNKQFETFVKGYKPGPDSTARIRMLSYAPNHLIYEYQASQPRLTLFSEIYYNKGWLAYIDGKPAPHFRADYVLRAMVLPPGQHKVEFYFKPKGYYVGNKIDLASSSILILLFIGGLVLEVTKKKNENI